MPSKDKRPDQMQSDETTQPVVSNARLARMTESAPRPRKIDGKILKMIESVDENATPAGKTDRMAKADIKDEDEKPRKEMPDQEGRKPDSLTTAAADDGYVRVRMHVENGEITVIGAKAVEGPLTVQERVQAELVFEVTNNKRRISMGNILDVGVSRGFPDPQGRATGHSIIPTPSFDFTVRVPKKEFSETSLSRLSVVVYRAKGTLPEEIGNDKRGFAAHEQLREVARMDGIKMDNLAGDVREQVRRAVK